MAALRLEVGEGARRRIARGGGRGEARPSRRALPRPAKWPPAPPAGCGRLPRSGSRRWRPARAFEHARGAALKLGGGALKEGVQGFRVGADLVLELDPDWRGAGVLGQPEGRGPVGLEGIVAAKVERLASAGQVLELATLLRLADQAVDVAAVVVKPDLLLAFVVKWRHPHPLSHIVKSFTRAVKGKAGRHRGRGGRPARIWGAGGAMSAMRR